MSPFFCEVYLTGGRRPIAVVPRRSVADWLWMVVPSLEVIGAHVFRVVTYMWLVLPVGLVSRTALHHIIATSSCGRGGASVAM